MFNGGPSNSKNTRIYVQYFLSVCHYPKLFLANQENKCKVLLSLQFFETQLNLSLKIENTQLGFSEIQCFFRIQNSFSILRKQQHNNSIDTMVWSGACLPPTYFIDRFAVFFLSFQSPLKVSSLSWKLPLRAFPKVHNSYHSEDLPSSKRESFFSKVRCASTELATR